MCLQLRSPKLRKKPHNSSRIRWKVVYISGDGSLRTEYRAFEIKRKGRNVAETKGLPKTKAGFHVFVDRKDANNAADSSHSRLIRIRVSGFLRSGYWVGWRSETWKSFTILRITKPR